MVDPSTPEEILDDETLPSDEAEKGRSVGLIWRIVAGVTALVIIAGLIYPLFPRSSQVAPLPTPTIAPAMDVTLEATPNSAQGWFELGKTYYKAGQWEQAVAAFKQVIALDPQHQAAYANLGATYHRLNQLDQAETHYQKALELNPKDGEVVYNLAALYLQKAMPGGGQPDPVLVNQALDQLRRAQELSPNAAEPYFGLGVAYMMLNQRDQAIQAFETFLKRDSGQDPQAGQEAQRYLKMLRGQ
jgi:tetratricopeptide (TPR) repeat protein